ncbi:MAG: formyltransferase family protein [Planctomycetia bacterium]|jgi:methionyl-tRNA formyltransferase
MSTNHPNNAKANERPRVGFVVVDDGLYTHRWVVPMMEQEFQTVCVVCLNPYWAVDFNPRNVRGLWPVVRSRLTYYGFRSTAKFARKAATAVIKEWLFRAKLGGTPQSVASAADARSVEILRPKKSDLNDTNFRDRLKALDLDLLVCAFSQKADIAFLDIPKLGCLNVHFSYLPQHRGREPLFHAMRTGQGAGVSVHWMSSKLDAGPIVFQQPLQTSGFHTLDRLIMAACDLATNVVPIAIKKAQAGQIGKIDACSSMPLAGWPSPEEVAQFKAQGFRFI